MKRGNEKIFLVFIISLVFMISLSTSLNITSPTENNTTLEYKFESLNIEFNVSNETNISWSINDTSNFSIENSTGVLTNNTNLSIGKYPLKITATNLTSGNSTSKNFTIFVWDLKAPKIILPNENSFYNNQSISLQFNATDASDISNQSSVTNLNQSLGNLTFNYTSGILSNSSVLGIGNYSINVTVIDIHNNTNSTIFNLEIKNSTQENESEEDVDTQDTENTTEEETCETDWNCTSWSECEEGTQTRTCEDENDCDNETDKPSEERNCTVECNPSWTCNEWSECINGKKTRTCEDDNGCGSSEGKPEEEKTCTIKEPICEPNWECTNWSECTNKTKTRNCTDLNECKNSGGEYTEEKKCSNKQKTKLDIKNTPSTGVIIISIISSLGIATTLYFRNKDFKIKKAFKKKK